MLERIIAYHCGPALAGIKPANIVSCRKSRIPDVHKEIERLNVELNKKDIYLDVICECDKRVLVMAYRKDVLEKHLQNPEIKEFLADFGYPRFGTVAEYLDLLRIMINKGGFPHEIGVFLGYPLHDIYGFINHRDEGCLLIGEWRVYKDAENAKKLFLRYKACKNAVLKRVTSGHTLAQIFCAA